MVSPSTPRYPQDTLDTSIKKTSPWALMSLADTKTMKR